MEFKNLKRIAIEEAEKLDAMYANKSEFSDKDAELYKCLMSGLKDQLTAEAMMNAEEYSEDGVSERRGRAANGRYVSREGNSGNSYADGYSRGYSEGMREGMSSYRMPYSERYSY